MRIVRKLLPLLGLCLLLTGCDLRNRQSSELYIPTGTRSEQTAPLQPVRPVPPEPTDPEQSPGADSEENPHVRVLLEKSGSFRYGMEPVNYSYRVPMLDLPGAQAVGCNQEIDERFGAPVRQDLEAMERGEMPQISVVDFDSFELGGILTLRMFRQDQDGAFFEGYYTVEASSGERVTARDLLAAVGLSGSLAELTAAAARRTFVSRYEGTWSEEDPAYADALTRTLAGATAVTVSMAHLTRDGRLSVAAEIFSPAGGSEWTELSLP